MIEPPTRPAHSPALPTVDAALVTNGRADERAERAATRTGVHATDVE